MPKSEALEMVEVGVAPMAAPAPGEDRRTSTDLV